MFIYDKYLSGAQAYLLQLTDGLTPVSETQMAADFYPGLMDKNKCF